MERATGTGGVFVRSAQPDRLRAWYVEHLGVDCPMEHENGRFGWGVDCDGNRFELWEPVAGQ